MKKKLLALNTISSILYQGISIICAFILPRLILKAYGSETNGLVNSIEQFLTVISFLEFGVGAVVQSNLYKPLVEKNNKAISEIVVSANNFFRRIVRIFGVYIVILMIVFPFFKSNSFGALYTVSLICILALRFMVQYYFGLVDQLVLKADQRGYISYFSQCITIILTTIISVIMINMGASIQAIKLFAGLLFIVRPVIVRKYIDNRYLIDRKIKITNEPIKQKWNGVAQHIAAVVLGGTDNIVLTIFSTLSNVSIYSVYNMILMGVKQLLISLSDGFQAILGESWAKEDKEGFNSFFSWVEWLLHSAVVLVFGCTAILIVPFVKVYTNGVSDVNYIQPLFAILITIAHAGHCIRLPYNITILAVGHYKQTQKNYIIAVIINLVISVATVIKFGLVGVAIGTVVAMFYQTLWMAYYDYKYLLNRSVKYFVKQAFVDAISITLGILLTRNLQLVSVSYMAWGIMAVEVFGAWCLIVAVVNILFYKEKLGRVYIMLGRKKE